MSEKWGPGDSDNWRFTGEVQHFETGEPFDLFYGEHPHGRRDNDLYALLRFGDGPMDADERSAVAFSGHRVRTEIEIVEFNYMKSSGLTGDEIKKGCHLRVKLDGDLTYTKFFREARSAAIWWAANDHQIFEHPVWLARRGERDKLIGRAVYFRDQPGVVTHYFPDRGTVAIAYDGEGEGFKTPGHRSLSDVEEIDESVTEDILDPSIWWFRDREGDSK